MKNINIGDSFYVVIPSKNPLYDGMVVYETIAEVKTDGISINGYPLKYCFKSKEEADAFSEQENKKGYQAYNDFFNHSEEVGVLMYGKA